VEKQGKKKGKEECDLDAAVEKKRKKEEVFFDTRREMVWKRKEKDGTPGGSLCRNYGQKKEKRERGGGPGSFKSYLSFAADVQSQKGGRGMKSRNPSMTRPGWGKKKKGAHPLLPRKSRTTGSVIS